MNLFTKIKQGWRARHRRRLAAKLQRMIAAAADENNGVLSLHCDIILGGGTYMPVATRYCRVTWMPVAT